MRWNQTKKKLDKMFSSMHQTFNLMDEVMEEVDGAPEHPSGTIIRRTTVVEYPDGRTEKTESTTKVEKTGGAA